MAPPVQGQGPVNPVPFANPVLQRPAPGGVGDAPTTGPAPVEKGYIQRFVLWAADWVVWLFMKICCCCKREEKPPEAPPQPAPQQQVQQPVPQQPPPPPVNPERARHQQLFNDLPYMTRGEDIIRHFNEYFTPDEKEYIYNEIGRSAPRSWRHVALQSYSTIGQNMVQQNAKLLVNYLIPRVNQRLNDPANR